MGDSFKRFWAGWKRVAHKIGVAQTYVIITLLYWLIIPLFSLIRLQNPLRLRQPDGHSFWIERKPADNSLDRAKQQS